MNAARIAVQQSTRDGGRARPWYREPMVWLVVAIPALTVVGGLTTVVIAHLRSDVVVADEYRQQGLAIGHDPTRDRAAQRLGIRAGLALEGGTLSVRLDPGTAALPSELVVLLSHATRAEQDRLVTLQATAAGAYSAPLPPLAPGHWYLEVSPRDRGWRLTGEFVDTFDTLTLGPGTIP
jgi:uncharacterized protein